MNDLKFYTLDAFSERKYAGTQLAVFTEGAELAREDMRPACLYRNTVDF